MRGALFIAMGLMAGSFSLTVSASVPTSVEWVDGESGRLNGKPFRLHDVDAPEIGGVGAKLRGAQCAKEVELGFRSRAYMAKLTRGRPVHVTAEYGIDPFGRMIVDLSMDEQDLAEAGLSEGVLRGWPEEQGRDAATKPDWCE